MAIVYAKLHIQGKNACRGAEPPDRLAAGILHPERFVVLDDGPGRREAAGSHCPTRAKCSRARIIAGLSGLLTLNQSRDAPIGRARRIRQIYLR
jgi:hypothetical protein